MATAKTIFIATTPNSKKTIITENVIELPNKKDCPNQGVEVWFRWNDVSYIIKVNALGIIKDGDGTYKLGNRIDGIYGFYITLPLDGQGNIDFRHKFVVDIFEHEAYRNYGIISNHVEAICAKPFEE